MSICRCCNDYLDQDNYAGDGICIACAMDIEETSNLDIIVGDIEEDDYYDY